MSDTRGSELVREKGKAIGNERERERVRERKSKVSPRTFNWLLGGH